MSIASLSSAANAGCPDFSINRIASDTRYIVLRTLSTSFCGTAAIDPDAPTARASDVDSCCTAGSTAGVSLRCCTNCSTSARGFADGATPFEYFAKVDAACVATATKVCDSAGVTALFSAYAVGTVRSGSA